jgi:hypothetical protein
VGGASTLTYTTRKLVSVVVSYYPLPVGSFWNQELNLLRKRGTKVEQHAVLPVAFVPMTREENK